MKVLAIVSQKGGAGKTTLATHLAVAAETHGLSTALFDLDQQASAALWSDRRGEGFPAVVPAQAPRLAGLIEQARQKGADLVILDTPPEASAVAVEAVRHADACLIPCRPSGLDLAAIPASILIAKNAVFRGVQCCTHSRGRGGRNALRSHGRGGGYGAYHYASA